MLKDLKKTSKHTGIYAIGNTATKVVGLLLIPLYTDPKYLSVANFGALAVLEATSALIVGVLSFAMIQSLGRWYWDENYVGKQKSIFFTVIAFLLFLLIPIGGITIFFSESLSQLLFKSSMYVVILKYTIATSLIRILNNQVFCLVKLQSRSMLFTALKFIKLTFTLLLTIYGVVKLNRGLEAIWFAALIGEIVCLALFLPYIVKNSRARVHFGILKEMLGYGLPLMLASVSGVLLSTADRYMLSSMSGLEKTGIYSLGFRIANTLKVVISSSLALAVSPLKFQYMNKPNNQRFYSKVNTYTGFIFSIALVALSLFALELLILFTGSDIYWEANYIVPIISFALFFGLLKDNIMIGLSITKKTKIIGTLIFMTSLINILLNVLLIPMWDIYGAAFATLFSQLLFFVSINYYSQKSYPIPYEWKKVGVMACVAAVLIAIGFASKGLPLAMRLIIKFSLLISYPFILYPFNFYEKVELSNIRNIVMNWSNPRKMRENFKRLFS